MTIRRDWQLTTMVALSDLEELLPDNFYLEKKDQQQAEFTLLDDYDWSVWSAGFILLRSTGQKIFLHQDNGKLVATDTAADTARFWWDLPAGELAVELEKIVPLRAFQEKCLFTRKEQLIAILNTDDKTVCRLQLLQLKIADQGECCLMALVGLRGYEAETELIATAWQGLASAEMPLLILKEQLLQAGLSVEKPVVKPTFDLMAQEPVEPALMRMIARLLDIARSQEAGMLADIDSEFVHQYRVNIRKARSVVSLFKKVFDRDYYQALNDALKNLGKRTNTLRDLDVFLLDYATYQQMLPENLHPGLKQLAERLRRRRRTAFKRVVKELQDSAYSAELSRLDTLLAQEPGYAAEKAQRPLKQLVAGKITKQYARIVKDGAHINDTTPDQAVHDLRIECKKLRYLLELFVELYSAGEIKKLIKQLKLLQDNLGRFNDFAVQREFLGHLADVRQISSEQLATINGLQAVLFDRQRQERGYVVTNISRFSAANVQQVFHEIFTFSTQESEQE